MKVESPKTYDEQCDDINTFIGHNVNFIKKGHDLKCGIYITDERLKHVKEQVGKIHKRSKLPAMLATFYTEETTYKLMKLLRKDNVMSHNELVNMRMEDNNGKQ